MYIKNLKEFRESKNLTQENIAEVLEMKRPQYSRYETGKRDLPVDCLVKLAEFYNTTTDNLLGLKNNIN